MNWKDYQVEQALGDGFFEAYRLDDGVRLLVRELAVPEAVDSGKLEAALVRLQGISHPGLIPPQAWKVETGRVRIAYTGLSGASLHTQLKAGLAVRSLVNIMSDVIEGLETLHRHGIVHGEFSRRGICKMPRSGGLLLTPGSLSALANVHEEPGGADPELVRSLYSQDMYGIGCFMLSVLRGSNALSLPPVEGEADVSRLLPTSDRALTPIFVPLLQGHWDDEQLTKFRDAISVLELQGAWPTRQVHTGEISRRELFEARAGASEIATPRSRRALRRRAARQRPRPGTRRLRGGGLGLGGALVAIIMLTASATAVLYMSPGAQEVVVSSLRELGVLPEPFRQGTDVLLAQGADSNSGLALRVAAYRSLLARSPGHEQAAAGLRQLIAGTHEEIDIALAGGRLEVAGQRLREALNLFPQDSEFHRQLDELSERRVAERLFANTIELVQASRLSDVEALSAIDAYREVVRLWPTHAGADNALMALARHFAEKAQTSMFAEDVTSAMMFLEHAARANSTAPEVTAVRQQIQRETSILQEIENLLATGSRYLASDALVNPPGANAAEVYGRVLAVDPDNATAVQGLRQVTSGVIEEISRATVSGDYGLARRLLTGAFQASLDETALGVVAQQLEVEEERTERLASLLSEAEAQLAQGFITAPEEGNLLATLFEVQTLDSDNARALRMAETASLRLVEVAEDAWNAGFPAEAREYLRLALTLQPDNEDWMALREAWSEAPS